MSTESYDTKTHHGIAALYLDGCTARGIATFLGIAVNTAKKHAARAEEYVSTYADREEFMRLNLRADYSAAIKQRTADGTAGRLGGRRREGT